MKNINRNEVRTANRWHAVTENPIAKGAVGATSERFRPGSQDANTVNTSTNVTTNSTPKPSSTLSTPFMVGSPRTPWTAVGVRTLSRADPATAPRHWATTNRTARATLTWPVTSIPNVTAGLMWPPPATCDRHHTDVETASPNASDTYFRGRHKRVKIL